MKKEFHRGDLVMWTPASSNAYQLGKGYVGIVTKLLEGRDTNELIRVYWFIDALVVDYSENDVQDSRLTILSDNERRV